MAYETLRTLFYKDGSSDRYSHADALTRQRVEAESTFRTGMETPAGELFLAVPRELSVLNEQVLRRERRIASRMGEIPPIAQWAMIRGLVVDEVVSTNELEGVHSTRRQINELLQSDRSTRDPLEQKRFRELAKLYVGLTEQQQPKPRKPEDIRLIYDSIMDGEPLEATDLPDGRLFRKDRVDIIGPGSRVVHEGLYPEREIIAGIEKMLAIAGSEEMPETFSSIVSHFIFEYVHPFYDGNGRTGRYLLALYLSSPLSILTSLSLSRVIAANRDAYYRSFREAEHPLNHGELTHFVMNMLENVRIAQDDLDMSLSEKKELLDQMGENLPRFAARRDLSEKELRIVYMLAQLDLFAAFPEAPQQEVADYIRLGKQQSRVYTRSLEEKGVIVAASRRPLRFKLTEPAAVELGLRG